MSLAAIRGEALGLHVVQHPAAGALDLDFIATAGLGQQLGAVAATQVLHALESLSAWRIAVTSASFTLESDR